MDDVDDQPEYLDMRDDFEWFSRSLELCNNSEGELLCYAAYCYDYYNKFTLEHLTHDTECVYYKDNELLGFIGKVKTQDGEVPCLIGRYAMVQKETYDTFVAVFIPDEESSYKDIRSGVEVLRLLSYKGKVNYQIKTLSEMQECNLGLKRSTPTKPARFK